MFFALKSDITIHESYQAPTRRVYLTTTAAADMERQTPAPQASSSSPQAQNPSSPDISAEYEIPSPQPWTSFNALKDRIRHHYEISSDYYYSLW